MTKQDEDRIRELLGKLESEPTAEEQEEIELKKKLGSVEIILRKANDLAESGEIKAPEDITKLETMYGMVKSAFFDLPSGCVEEKIAMQESMLDLYRKVISHKKSILGKDSIKFADDGSMSSLLGTLRWSGLITRSLMGGLEKLSLGGLLNAGVDTTGLTSLDSQYPTAQEPVSVNSFYQPYIDPKQEMENQSNTHYGNGNELVRKGRTDEAMREYHEAVRFNPDNWAAHYALGNGYYTQRRYHDAEREYKKTISLNPSDPAAYYALALVYNYMGNKSQERRYVEESRRRGGQYYEVK